MHAKTAYYLHAKHRRIICTPKSIFVYQYHKFLFLFGILFICIFMRPGSKIHVLKVHKQQCRRSYILKFKSLLFVFHIWLVLKQLCLPQPPQDLWPTSPHFHPSLVPLLHQVHPLPNHFTSYSYIFTFSCLSSSLIFVSQSSKVWTLIVPFLIPTRPPICLSRPVLSSDTHSCFLNSTTTIIPSVLPSSIFPFAISFTPFPFYPIFINHHPFLFVRCTQSLLQGYIRKNWIL